MKNRNPNKNHSQAKKFKANTAEDILAPLFDRSKQMFMSWNELKQASIRASKDPQAIKIGGPQIFSNSNRIMRPFPPSDLCHLSSSYNTDEFQYLLNQAIAKKNNFRIYIKVLINLNDERLYSLEPEEILEFQKNLNPYTMICYDPFESPMAISLNDLWASKIETSNLLTPPHDDHSNSENFGRVSRNNKTTLLAMDPNKPSLRAKDTTIAIHEEFQSILINSRLMADDINRDLLWSLFEQKVRDKKSNLFTINKSGEVSEKYSGKIITKKSTHDFRTKVIDWYINANK